MAAAINECWFRGNDGANELRMNSGIRCEQRPVRQSPYADRSRRSMKGFRSNAGIEPSYSSGLPPAVNRRHRPRMRDRGVQPVVLRATLYENNMNVILFFSERARDLQHSRAHAEMRSCDDAYPRSCHPTCRL